MENIFTYNSNISNVKKQVWDTLMIIIKTRPITPITDWVCTLLSKISSWQSIVHYRFQIYIHNCVCLYLCLLSFFSQIISPPVDAEEISLVSQRERGLCYGPSAKQDQDVCSWEYSYLILLYIILSIYLLSLPGTLWHTDSGSESCNPSFFCHCVTMS